MCFPSLFGLYGGLIMTVSEKVAYLKGLMEGLGVDPKSKDGKIYNAIVDVLTTLASDMEDVEANAAATADAVNDISEDLSYIEEFIDTFEDEEDDEFDDEDDDCCCDYNCDEWGMCGEEEEEDEPEDEDEEIEDVFDLCDSQMYEVTCPACGDTISVDESILSLGKIECPGCGNILEFDLGDEDEE